LPNINEKCRLLTISRCEGTAFYLNYKKKRRIFEKSSSTYNIYNV